MKYSGEFLVKLARKTIHTYLKSKIKIKPPNDTPKDLLDQSGVFVTLHHVDTGKEPTLRGCIGRIESPNSTLVQSSIDSAVDAAFHDPRFPPVTLEEMSKITVEITVLTVPKKFSVNDPNEYLDLIIIGKHGLIAEMGPYRRGLLLPQVPIEQNWNVKQYLDYVCMKAGLATDAWKNKDTSIHYFEGIIFSEQSPNGKIERRNIK
ncbi:MAG: TIGR00296 family protein [Candidatus Hodarchaeales archaeon]|jgi:uncharacterized protein (TIGR00296 family)